MTDPASVTAAVIEDAAFAAWPPIEVVVMNEWRLHASSGLHRRLNSANATVDAGALPLPEVESWFRQRGLPPMVRITPLAPVDTDAMLDRAGYTLVAPTDVLVGPTDAAEPDPAVTLGIAPSEAWIQAKLQLSYADAVDLHHVARHTLVNAGPHPIYAAVILDGAVIAVGMAVRNARQVGLFGIATHPDHRGAGHGTAITGSLMAWGRDNGATVAYLQVEVDNPVARSVYEPIGFESAYRYHYRVLT